MKIRRCLVFLLLTALCVLSPLCAGAATTLEEIVEESMYEALRDEGIGDLLAGRISARYVFMGSVMINKIQVDDGDALLDQARLTGRALGTALATSYMQYGDEALQETASMMMLSARAGVAPEVAADTFAVLAQNGYTLDALIGVMRETSEVVRELKPNDGGVAIGTQISGMVNAQVSVGELRSEILSIAEKEKNRQRQLIALKEAERRKRDSKGGGGDGSSSASRGGGNGGNSSSGGASAAGAGASEGSGSDGAGDSGGGNSDSSGGNDSGDGEGDSATQ